ncbi:hypothetical protein M406DRAFT_329333 [Cryphonectria parasitica EP155]|uniref:Uncharacterized protein n=1 Tax=Cryphonectria parasitica (strain ATCC 38755 / EP155) TaxID=660469 RepID=A0A9P4Y2V1_CRYP1|nr:uncharacterized protein M406DRAFT_329333 [Cryphonectria parasitica EP155]KAF3765430.1 hypothetical protein M406DRAFT_329333 [Cryphonectria parasitica EP155]
MVRSSSSCEAKRQADGGDQDSSTTVPLRTGWRHPTAQTNSTQATARPRRNVTAPMGVGGVPAQQHNDAAAAAAAAAATHGQEGIRRLTVNQGRISVTGARGIAPAEDAIHVRANTVSSSKRIKGKTQASAEKVEEKKEDISTCRDVHNKDTIVCYFPHGKGETKYVNKNVKKEKNQTPAGSDISSPQLHGTRRSERRANIEPEFAGLPRPTRTGSSVQGSQASQASQVGVKDQGGQARTSATANSANPSNNTTTGHIAHARTDSKMMTTMTANNAQPTTSGRVTRSKTKANNANVNINTNTASSSLAVAPSSRPMNRSRTQNISSITNTGSGDNSSSGPAFAWDVPDPKDTLKKRPHWKQKRMTYPEGYDPHTVDEVAAHEAKYARRLAMSGSGAAEQYSESNVRGAVDEDPREREVKRVMGKMVKEAMAKNKAEEEAEKRNKARMHPDISTSFNKDVRERQPAAPRNAPQAGRFPPVVDGPRPGQMSTAPAEFFPGQTAHMFPPGNAHNRMRDNASSLRLGHEEDEPDLLQLVMDRMHETEQRDICAGRAPFQSTAPMYDLQYRNPVASGRIGGRHNENGSDWRGEQQGGEGNGRDVYNTRSLNVPTGRHGMPREEPPPPSQPFPPLTGPWSTFPENLQRPMDQPENVGGRADGLHRQGPSAGRGGGGGYGATGRGGYAGGSQHMGQPRRQ